MLNTVSLISPSRSTLKYLKWSYESVRKLYPDVEYCVGDDASDDGTEEWCKEIAAKDKNFKYAVNPGPDRIGHTIFYDQLIENVATRDFVMIWHSDMAALPNMLENMMKYAKSGRVVSATRIEPPLHPDGPEKEIIDCGIEVEEYDESLALSENARLQEKYKDGTTDGIFAPWLMLREDFLAINGHDPLYAPQSKEDSDIFNRFKLAGYRLIQSRDAFCYHMTCRGSRFKDGATRNPNGEVFMKNRETDEWLQQNIRSTRNFIRKWGTMVKHDENLHPIIDNKYDIGLKINNCTSELLIALEPWCSSTFTDLNDVEVSDYIRKEQPNTMYDLSKRIFSRRSDDVLSNDIIIEFDANNITNQNITMISQFPAIIKDSGDVGIGQCIWVETPPV